MTNLTPEAVKAALKEHVESWDENGQWLYGETTPLEEMVEAITRDWLRLKEVEKAGKELHEAAEWFMASKDAYMKLGGANNAERSILAQSALVRSLAAFRAAVEVK